MSESLKLKFSVGEGTPTVFIKANNIRQDGTTPMYRDVDGTLWAMSGHSHLGEIAMFKGTCLDDIQKVHKVETNFCVGNANYAFAGIRYPEGIQARGSIWPFGLYICPNTHRFFCFFHNESGWNGKGTAYDAYGFCETPLGDSDFRHIGLMHSDDEGANWTFDRWVLTAEEVCFTEKFNPNHDIAKGQKAGMIKLGSGDFSTFVNHRDGYIYLVYNILQFNMDKGLIDSCNTYLARARIRTDGMMSDFVKYYDGSFCEAGNLGKESVVVPESWHSRIIYSEDLGVYLLTDSYAKMDGQRMTHGIMEVRTSKDLIHWSEPQRVMKDGQYFGNHYIALVSDSKVEQPNVFSGNKCSVLINGNATDVMRHPIEISVE